MLFKKILLMLNIERYPPILSSINFILLFIFKCMSYLEFILGYGWGRVQNYFPIWRSKPPRTIYWILPPNVSWKTTQYMLLLCHLHHKFCEIFLRVPLMWIFVVNITSWGCLHSFHHDHFPHSIHKLAFTKLLWLNI